MSGRDARGVRAADPASRRRTRVTVMLLVAAALVLCIPAYGVWQVLLAPQVVVSSGQAVQIEIPQGAGTARIAEMLVGAGVVDNGAMFRLRARLDGIDGRLRPGVYDLETGMSYSDVVAILLEGPPLAYVTVTIPEGFTLEKIAERLEGSAGIPAAEFLALAQSQAAMFTDAHPYLAGAYNGSLEGYLFPKTYRIAEGSTASAVIEMMLDQFDAETVGLDLSYAASRGLTLNDVVVVASMVEREARVAEERPIVSSVIYNRLSRGMRLEIDATIEYVIKKNRPRLLNRDLEVESPYNTYKYLGLPPGPIANPGLASLEAAAAPAETAYLYYVLTSADGSHTFTETLEEFLIAKEKSREVTP